MADHVATITLNAPERMNTISGAMLDDLSARLLEADRDREVRCIVLTGAGRAFCAGLDLAAQMQRAEGIARQPRLRSTPRPGEFDLRDAPPIVLHQLDTPDDLRPERRAPPATASISPSVATSGSPPTAAKLNPGFAKRGILPESGGTWLLPRMVGYAKAAEIAFTGRTLTADRGARARAGEPGRARRRAREGRRDWPPRSPPTRRWRCGRSSG